MAANFLQKSRHDSVFYFRRRVPADLSGAIGKRQIYKSLDTTDRREAIIRARALATYTDEVFARFRAMSKKNTFRTEYKIHFSFDTMGRPTAVEVEADPGEHEAAQKALETVVNGLPSLQQSSPVPEAQPSLPASTLVDPTLAEGIAQYLSKVDVKPTTRASYKTKLAYLVGTVGADTSLFSIDQARFVILAETIVADDSRHDQTKGDYITIICGFLNWHRLRKGLPPLTAATLKPKRMTPALLDREAFTIEHLRVLFESAAAYRFSEPHKYWATVGVAFLGCRVEELAQVNLHTDLRQDPTSGVWYLAFEETADADGVVRKSLKKHSSWRHVPIHSALVHHGFIEYLATQRNGGFSRPFEAGWKPHIGKTDNSGVKWSHKITKWGGAELSKLTKAENLPNGSFAYFHSMRHSFANTLATAAISEEYRSALQGQAYGSINSQTYAKLRYDHNALSKIIESGLEGYLALILEPSGSIPAAA
jgi:hypothetical protein